MHAGVPSQRVWQRGHIQARKDGSEVGSTARLTSDETRLAVLLRVLDDDLVAVGRDERVRELVA